MLVFPDRPALATHMKKRLISLLRWSEQYTKTDMVYMASGAFWSNFNVAIVTLLTFFASVLFARYLTKEAYGMYQYVLSIASLIGATTLTGMNAAVARAVARGHEGEVKHSVRYQLMAGVVPAALGIAVSIWYFVHNNQGLGIAFLSIAIFLPLSNAFNTWVAYLGGKKLFRIGSYYGLSNYVASYVPVILAIFFARNFLWVVFANYFFAFVFNFITYRLVMRNLPPNDERDPETIPFGAHMSLMGVFGVFAGQLDSLLVFHFVGSAALAVYSFATVIPERAIGLLKFIPGISMPKLAERSEAEVRQIMAKKLWVFIAIIAVAAICYAVLAPWVFHTFFPAYSSSILFTQVYALSFFSLATTMVQTALTSQKKTKELYIVSFVMPAFRIALLSVFMFYWGIWGLVWAQISLNFIGLAVQLGLLWKKPAVGNVQNA